MTDVRTWQATAVNAQGDIVAKAQLEIGFKTGSFGELMDLLDYAYFASAEKPLLTLPTDHEIKIVPL